MDSTTTRAVLLKFGHRAGSVHQMSWIAASPSSWFLALDGHLIRPPPWQITVPRIAFVLAALMGYAFFTVVLVIHFHWCCYPDDTGVDDFDRGLCTNASAPIRSDSGYQECTARTTSIVVWVALALFLLPAIVWLAVTALRQIELRHHLSRAILGDAEYIAAVVAHHHVDKPTADTLIEAIAALEDSRHRLWHEVKPHLRSPALLSRAWIYLIEPLVVAALLVAATLLSPYQIWDLTFLQWLLLVWLAWTMVFLVPAIVADMPIVHNLVSVASTAVWLTCAVTAALLVLPEWRRTCCRSSHLPAAAWDALPGCTDMPDEVDAVRECTVGTWTWQLWTVLVCGSVGAFVCLANYLVVATIYLTEAGEFERAWIVHMMAGSHRRFQTGIRNHMVEILAEHQQAAHDAGDVVRR